MVELPFKNKNKPISSVDVAVSNYSEKEFRSPMRSTVPLLSWLKHEEPAVRRLLLDLGMPADSSMYLEYQVPVQKGKGVASHTDLMVRSSDCSLAVEAKWTEPRYETVRAWLKKGKAPQNRKDVFEGWLGLLQPRAGRRLAIEDFHGAIYQMVHRAASSCAEINSPRMVYLVFRDRSRPELKNAEEIKSDMEHLWKLMGRPQDFPFYLVEQPFWPTPAFEEIFKLWKPDKTNTDKTTPYKEISENVKSALYGGSKLFSFEKYSVTKIGE
ncbi:MAG: hypothetical protein AB1921_07150 [Thermodesulfobacteriota bacterium]